MQMTNGWIDPNDTPPTVLIDYQVVIYEPDEEYYRHEWAYMAEDGNWCLIGGDELRVTPVCYQPMAPLPEHLWRHNQWIESENLWNQRRQWPVDGDGSPIDRPRVAPEVYA